MDNGFQGREGERVPEMTKEIIAGITERYIELYERITGKKFVKAAPGHSVVERIENNVTSCLKKLRTP